MRIFNQRETRSYTDEEKEILISTFPGFVGVPSGSYTSAKSIENSDVWTAVHMIASDIASLTLQKYFNGVNDPTDTLTELINIKPNPYYSGYQFKFIMVSNALLNGESFAEVIRDKQGNITKLYYVDNSLITYQQNESTKFELVYEIQKGNEKKRLSSNNILHFKFFSLDGIKGESPLRALKDDMDTQKHSKKFLSNFFRNGTQSGGILKIKGSGISNDAKIKMREDFQKAYSGIDHAHKTLVVDETMDYEPIKIDTEILKLINTSNHSTMQVAKVFKIPRHKFGLETSNMNIEQMNMDYLVNTLTPYLESMVNEIAFKLIDDSRLSIERYRFNTDNYKMIDAETKTKNVKTLVETGVYNLDDARAEFGKEALPDGMGNKHFVSLNYTTLDNLEEYQMQKATNLPISKSSTEGGDQNGEGN